MATENVYLKSVGGIHLGASNGSRLVVGSYETYMLKYRFEFVSQGGAEWRVDIRQKGFSGVYVRGRMGASPVFSVKRNGRVFGTSLALTLEATRPGMYMDIAASDYREYMAELRSVSTGARLWRGFIMPEEYSVQERPLPYDIAFTATDCIADLRDCTFAACGPRTILAHLRELLSPALPAGDTQRILLTGSLRTDLDDDPEWFLANDINIDHLAGKSYYDVLQSLLETFNATVQYDGGIHLIRDIDVGAQDWAVREVLVGRGTGSDVAPPSFGRSSSYRLWPVGVLAASVEPPRKSVTVTAPDEYIERADKVLRIGSLDGGVCTVAPGGFMSFAFRADPSAWSPSGWELSFDLLLTIPALATAPAEDSGGAASMSVRLSATDRDGQARVLKPGVGNRYSSGWVRSYAEYTGFGVAVRTVEEGSGRNFEDYGVAVRALYSRGAPWRRVVGDCNVEVKVVNDGDRPLLLDYDHIRVAVRDRREGRELTVRMGNYARRDADAAEVLVPADVPVGQQRLLYGVVTARDAAAAAARWSSFRVASAPSCLQLVATELALENYFARKRLDGRLQVDTRLDRFPLFLREGATGVLYRVQSMSYELLSDEMDVSLLSLAAAGTVDIGTEDADLGDKQEYRLRKLEEKMRQLGILYGIY